MSTKFDDLTGRRFGDLTVEGLEIRGPSGSAIWKCRCDCGNVSQVREIRLLKGRVKSCGCRKYGRDLSGKRYGNLTVVQRAESSQNCGMWECVCDCGNTVNVRTSYLKNGRKTSCSEICTMTFRMIGRKYGKLTVIAPDGFILRGKNKVYKWRCKCDCGREVSVAKDLLGRDGERTSCGCDNVEYIGGERFGKLTARSWYQDVHGLINWKCDCDCGNEVDAQQHKIVRGVVRSCGCDPNEISLDEKCNLVYVVEANNRIKIGASRSFWKRLATLQTWCPVRLRVVRLFKGAWLDEEAALHQALIQFRAKGEWFVSTPDMLEAIESAPDADTLIKLLNEKYAVKTPSYRPSS